MAEPESEPQSKSQPLESEPQKKIRRARRVGRYEILGKIGTGGMAAVYIGRMTGEVGFARRVAIKQLHAHLASDEEYVEMFIDEARVASRVQHPNVVSTLDVLVQDEQVYQVLEYVEGESLARILRRATKKDELLPRNVVGAIMVSILDGLHAAHEAVDPEGNSMNLIHRDVSPQNILVGKDGVARLIDFGVAKAEGRAHATRAGQVKGKFNYMPPEQLKDDAIDRRADIFAAAAVLWEMLVGQRMRGSGDEAALYARIMSDDVSPPSEFVDLLPKSIDNLVMKGVAPDPEDRYVDAQEFSEAISRTLGRGSTKDVRQLVAKYAGEDIERRAEVLRRIEEETSTDISVSRLNFMTGDHSDVRSKMGSEPGSASGAGRAEHTGSFVAAPAASIPATTVPPIPPAAGRSGGVDTRTVLLSALAAGAVCVAVVMGLRGCEQPRPTAQPTADRSPDGRVDTQATATSVVSPSAIAAVTAGSPLTAEASAATPATSASAPLTVAAQPSPPPPIVTPRPAVARPKPRAKPEPPPPQPTAVAPPPPPKTNCNPPYYLTADGTRRYKAECL